MIITLDLRSYNLSAREFVISVTRETQPNIVVLFDCYSHASLT